MNKKLFVVFACVLMVILTGCQSVKVDRIDAETAIDLSGYWNDTDIRIVADSLIKECVNAPAIENYIRNNRMSVAAKIEAAGGTLTVLSAQ